MYRRSKFATLVMISASIVLLAGCAIKPVEVSNNPNANRATNVAKEEPQKGWRDSKLQKESDALLPLFGKFPVVNVRVVDEPLQKSGSETERGVAYTNCSTDKIPTIYVKNAFYLRAPRPQLVNILKHELTHAWFCTQGIQTGHDPRFQKKFKEIGGFGN
ncbi:MAG: SprT-like domain-containing protein [Acidobacteria bacterium]|nr:SprT-like domain-containing protein [Acidobacteriota bacterium]